MDKVVFITGASRGIGRSLAERFISKDYFVIGTSTSGKNSLNASKFISLKLDLSSEKSINECVKIFEKLGKKIDILINNAGIWSGHDEDDNMYLDSLRKTLEVNLIGTISLTEKLLPNINEGGKIVNISSRAGSFGYMGNSYYPDYKISKAALNMYTKTLASRVILKKIMVASIHPGWVKTDMGGSSADLKPEEAADEIYRRIISLKETGQFWFKQDKFPW